MNIKRAKEEIKRTVRAYLEKDELGAYRIPAIRQRPLLLMGPPGIGKTQIMEQVSRECGIGLVAYTITHHTRQSAVGLPFIREREFDGETHSITEYTMSEIIASVYRTMEETGHREGILFIDEINCVSETLAPTMLQFLQGKTFGNQPVPQGWIIVAAGNPPEYNKAVREFDLVTLDRVRRMELEADLPVWREYARAQRLHPAILAYLELRPQHFYRIEADVDGTQFVTARGWEDLSNLLDAYERLDLPVDEELVHQFLQHEEIARDVAAYLELYRKYRDDYGVEAILDGRVRPSVYERTMNASFDERLSLVELLVSGLNVRFGRFLDAQNQNDRLYALLKEYHRELTAGEASPEAVWQALGDAEQQELDQQKKAGLLTRRDEMLRRRVLQAMKEWMPNPGLTPKAAFDGVRARFEAAVSDADEKAKVASEALEHAFTFLKEAFDEGQELVIFVTELTLGPDSQAFLAQFGSERFDRYQKNLLLGTRKAAITAELSREDVRSGEHSLEF